MITLCLVVIAIMAIFESLQAILGPSEAYHERRLLATSAYASHSFLRRKVHLIGAGRNPSPEIPCVGFSHGVG
jgi:hypothetical protein